jgi:hypothetical protein
MKNTRMRYFTALVSALTLVRAAPLAGQQPPAQRATARAAGESQPLTPADSVLLARERSQWQALQRQDTTAFGEMMGGGVVDVDLSGARRTSPSSVARFVTGCKTASFELTDFRVAHFSVTSVVTYKATVDQTCLGQKAPSPLYVMTVYEQREGSWLPVAHSETAAAHW